VNVSVVGISHRTAPVSVRERFALTAEELGPALARLRAVHDSAAVLSTCNRTEVYVADKAPVDSAGVADALASLRDEPVPEGVSFYHLEGEACARHLFRVAAGVESLVVGESEILGQVRAAFAAATAAGSSNAVLARLFHSAIRAGRRARAETEIGAHGVSVSATAVALVRRELGDLRRKTVLVVGAGDAARLTAQALSGAGTGRILVTTRTFERARDIATELGALAYPFEQLPSLIGEADIVISSTSAPAPVITRQAVQTAMASRQGRALVVVDIAVPRDVEAAAGEVAGVRLLDIDDLQAQADANREARLREVEAVEAIIDQEVARFATWLRQNGATPTIAALRRRADQAREAEVARTLARLPGLSAEERARIEAMSKAIVKRILHAPIKRLKEPASQPLMEAARELFGLESGEA
jgi:glutamyl-tRNA reductase